MLPPPIHTVNLASADFSLKEYSGGSSLYFCCRHITRMNVDLKMNDAVLLLAHHIHAEYSCNYRKRFTVHTCFQCMCRVV